MQLVETENALLQLFGAQLRVRLSRPGYGPALAMTVQNWEGRMTGTWTMKCPWRPTGSIPVDVPRVALLEKAFLKGAERQCPRRQFSWETRTGARE